MPDAALAGAGGGDLAGVLLDVGQELLGGLPLGVGGDGDAGAVLVHLRDRGEVLPADVGQALVVHHADLHRDQADRLTVGGGVDHRLVAHDAGSAGAVDDVDVGVHLGGELLADEAADAVGATAGSPGDDQLDGSAGVLGVDVVAALDGIVVGGALLGPTGAAGSHEGERRGPGDAGEQTAGGPTSGVLRNGSGGSAGGRNGARHGGLHFIVRVGGCEAHREDAEHVGEGEPPAQRCAGVSRRILLIEVSRKLPTPGPMTPLAAIRDPKILYTILVRCVTEGP